MKLWQKISLIALVFVTLAVQLTQAKGADAFVTGEVKHHEAIAAQQAGLVLYEAGHYHTELPYRERLKAYLDTACPGVEFIVSESERPPMETL